MQAHFMYVYGLDNFKPWTVGCTGRLSSSLVLGRPFSYTAGEWVCVFYTAGESISNFSHISKYFNIFEDVYY